MKSLMKSIGMVGLMLAATVASAASCPNVNVTVVNNTGQTVSGGLVWAPADFNSATYVINAHQSQQIGLTAPAPINGNFILSGNDGSCSNTIPAVNGCPDPTTRTTMTLSPNGSFATCSIVVQSITPTPAPISVPLFYRMINRTTQSAKFEYYIGTANQQSQEVQKTVAAGMVNLYGRLQVEQSATYNALAFMTLANGVEVVCTNNLSSDLRASSIGSNIILDPHGNGTYSCQVYLVENK